MEIASQIQTSVLPRTLDAEGLEIAARMVPASEVGGDYYELLPVEDGACWIGIGDVAGHGMPAGVVMLMIQTAVATFVRERPGATPADLIASINHVLFHNVRDRLRSDEHVTLCLLRHDGRGRIAFAGAHEEMVVFRAAASRAELIETPGTWIGFAEDISEMTMNGELELGVGDVLVVFTDGVTEAMNAGGEQFGIERLVEEVEARAGDSPEVMCDAILDRVAAWTDVQADDVTLMVVRRTDDA
jgi:sigma-B regulation protein RsbU (phosphoserine phosphatase)